MHAVAGSSFILQQAHLRTRALPHTDDAVLLWVKHLPNLAHGLQPSNAEVSGLWCNSNSRCSQGLQLKVLCQTVLKAATDAAAC